MVYLLDNSFLQVTPERFLEILIFSKHFVEQNAFLRKKSATLLLKKNVFNIFKNNCFITLKGPAQ